MGKSISETPTKCSGPVNNKLGRMKDRDQGRMPRGIGTDERRTTNDVYPATAIRALRPGNVAIMTAL